MSVAVIQLSGNNTATNENIIQSSLYQFQLKEKMEQERILPWNANVNYSAFLILVLVNTVFMILLLLSIFI